MSAIKDWINEVKFLEPHVKYNEEQNLFFPQPFYLFRGEAKRYGSPLKSRWDRLKVSKDEKQFYLNCFYKIFPNRKPFQSDINLRFIGFLQHNGFDTRLIDVTSSINSALYFAIREYPDETGYVYKLYGYNILSFSDNLDFADIDSIFYNPEFPSNEHPLLSQFPKLYLFYRDTNSYNINAQRQDGWFVFQTGYYRGDELFYFDYPITPEQKKAIKRELQSKELYDDFYFPDIKKIVREVK